MALKGTIKDFGVADIFQLISQQAKTGVLVLSNDVDEVRVYFRSGSVVRASNTLRTAQMLLGTLMVRAEVIDEDQLHQALKEQQRTLKRLGAVLVELGHMGPEVVTEFATLQMTETIYALFEWKFGTYEFETVDVEPSPEGVQPIRAETIVMNGIRMTDEWPGIRERISSYSWHVEQVRALPPPSETSKDSIDEFDFSSLGDDVGGGSAAYDAIGSYERIVYDLIKPGRTVQELLDLSRLGEFEACRSLSTLMGEGYIRILAPSVPGESDDDTPRIDSGPKLKNIVGAVGRIVVSAGLVVIAAMIGNHAMATVGKGPTELLQLRPNPVEARLAVTQMHRLRRSIEVYRFERGAYPLTLERLVEVGLHPPEDIRYPFERQYYYRLDGDTYELLPPVN